MTIVRLIGGRVSNLALADPRLGVAVTVAGGVCTDFTLVPVKFDPDERLTISPAAAANGTSGILVAGLNETNASRFDVDRHILFFLGGETGLRVAAKFPCSSATRFCVVNANTIFVAGKDAAVLLSADGSVTELPQPPITQIAHAAAFADGTIVVVGTKNKAEGGASCFYPNRNAWSTFWAPEVDKHTACVVANNSMYVIGGESRTCWSLRRIAGELDWARLPDAPFTRRGASAVLVEDRIFVLGGLPFTDSVDVLDIATQEWLERQWPKSTDGSIGLRCYNAAAVAVSAKPEFDDEDKPSTASPASAPKAGLKRPRTQHGDSESD